MMFSHCIFLWILFAVVDSHSPLTEKKAEDGIIKSSCLPNEILINNLQNQINQETLIRISLLKQVYSLVGDMINLKNEMAAMKTNAEETKRRTDDLRHDDNKILSEIAQIKQDHNNTSEIIINEQNEHDKMLSEIQQKMKINQNDTSERIIKYQREYEKIFSELEQKMKLNHNDTSERIVKAQLEYKTMFSKLKQNMESNHNDTSKRIVNIQNDLLNVNNSVELVHYYTDESKVQYFMQEKKMSYLVNELGNIRDRLDVLQTEDERIWSESQRMIANYSETTLKIREDLQNITSMVNDLDVLPLKAKDCLKSNHCWLQYSFEYDNSWTGCEGGTQYVKKTNYSTAPYLGVMTCSSTRYKLFLSRTATGKYYNIADSGGYGQDHCELLGSSKEGVLPTKYSQAPNTQEKTVRDLVSELEKIQGRLGVLHNESERMRSETQRMLVNYNETTLKMKGDLTSITTSMVNDLLNKRQVQECLESSHCWLLYSFEYDDRWNGCEDGTQYVKKTNYSSAPYLGVMTCTSTRYKLFLSKTLTGKYYNIADEDGSGDDHCELLGTTRKGVLPGDYKKSPNTQGFYRCSRGESFRFVKIGYTQSGKWYEKWIECGVNIPGDDRVIPM